MENRSGFLPLDPDPRTYTVAEFLELLRIAGVDEPTSTRVSDALREYFAALERKAVFKAHVKSQMAARASRDGETGRRLPLGYQRVSGTGVAIDEDGAATVRHIFHMNTRGFSLRGIAKQLNAERIPTSYGGKKWAASSVSQIINHEDMYRGAPRKDSPLCWPVILTPDLALDEPLSESKVRSTMPRRSSCRRRVSGRSRCAEMLLLSQLPYHCRVLFLLEARDPGTVPVSQPHAGWPEPAESPMVLPHLATSRPFSILSTFGSGDGLVNAVAGSGKQVLLNKRPSCFLAANELSSSPSIRKSADELSGRLRGTTMAAKTIHSVGYHCVAAALKTMLPHFQRLEPDKHARKYHRICRRGVLCVNAEHDAGRRSAIGFVGPRGDCQIRPIDHN